MSVFYNVKFEKVVERLVVITVIPHLPALEEMAL